MARPSHPPVWLVALVAVASALLVRALDAWARGPDADPAAGLVLVAGLGDWLRGLWNALTRGNESRGAPTLGGLQWNQNILRTAANATYESLKAIGQTVVDGLAKVWEFFKDVWKDVIKPLWAKLGEWYAHTRKWLEDTFRPLIQYLTKLRRWFGDFYKKWVRPILDAIDIARKVLRVLETLGIDWAKKLDGELAELQRRIDAPFRAVLAELNKVINWVNRVVTLDGLIQRVALIRSIERDIREVSRAFINWRSRPVTDADYLEHLAQWWELRGYSPSEAMRLALASSSRNIRTEREIWDEFSATVRPADAVRDPLTAEIAAEWKRAIQRR